MKSISKNGAYERVSDDVAEVRVNNQGWKFVSKQEWKKATRVITEKQTVESEKKETTVSEKALKRAKLKEKQRQ